MCDSATPRSLDSLLGFCGIFEALRRLIQRGAFTLQVVIVLPDVGPRPWEIDFAHKYIVKPELCLEH